MGTNGIQNTDEEQGLIPRFLFDLFENLNDSTNSKLEKRKYNLTVSFLEIYGEDIYDLLCENNSNGANGTDRSDSRSSLTIRENESGMVFVQGQQELQIQSASQAIDLLTAGSSQRITAATAMNAGSSRSHAVFTVCLQQNIISTSGEGDTMEHTIKSKLTFVDLAGSERIKRTCAEGQRMKEGIQINSGLFNLGQVINGLADDQRLQKGIKPQYIPYRNSKLTHLLKDALGGNSQTLFLACVSPAESNESETHSTLMYAKQARNIKNKPVKNTDKIQDEIRKLKIAVKTWMSTAVNEIFSNKKNSADTSVETPGKFCSSELNQPESPGIFIDSALTEPDLFSRPDVQAYIESINQSINLKVQGVELTPRKVRLSTSIPFNGLGITSGNKANRLRTFLSP